MSDYERYGDYDREPEEPDEGPPPHKAVVVTSKIVKILCIVLSVCICGILLFRICYQDYYPDFAKDLRYTDALRSYCEANGSPTYETQEIRVPYESSDKGWYHANNLILSREAGVLQISLRINERVQDRIRETYGLEEFAITDTAFRFVLENNGAYEIAHPDSAVGKPEDAPVTPPQTSLPTYIHVEKGSLYYYIKLCFDGVEFQDVSWMRLKIYVEGVTYQEDESDLDSICIYQNDETMSKFLPYKLSKREEYTHV